MTDSVIVRTPDGPPSVVPREIVITDSVTVRTPGWPLPLEPGTPPADEGVGKVTIDSVMVTIPDCALAEETPCPIDGWPDPVTPAGGYVTTVGGRAEVCPGGMIPEMVKVKIPGVP